MSLYSIEVFDAKKTSRAIVTIENVAADETVFDLKKRIAQKKPNLGVERQALRLEPKGKALKDEEKVGDLNLPNNGQLYLRDLGPQIGWKTVFLIEYAGPFFIYPIFYMRPSLIYGSDAVKPIAEAVKLAVYCSSFHYGKRLFETHFIHRFSNGTMPFMNLFKNCGYYWGFCAFVSYFVNHPLYTSPYFGHTQVYLGLAGFVLAELGNLSCHVLLRNLRPAGTKERKIPMPDGNPFTLAFNFVSCPNYLYEVLAWTSFTVMTQSLPAALFTAAGFTQMVIWAQNKHRAYKREFPNYPKTRTAIVPFVL
ncbi:hypothetical protein QR680_014227 [Steinernema hermaphroditum]|uniref:very-long-chain enoyl-CoA reductase n=1 Tax=Steinernema hermaphroditum TaxID=289476 RepID=A0AA39M3V4_9BILA|nr:hypothetical protein QR680_014227 [Steinernema hermaphroditum]